MTRWLRLGGSGAACIALVVVLARRLGSADMRATGRILAHAGPSVLLLAVPYLVAVACDAWGTSRLFAIVSRVNPVRAMAPLAGVRLRTDAFAATLPAGTVVADSLAPTWMHALAGTETADGVAVVAARKCLVGLAQAAYVALSFAIGYAVLRDRSHALLPGDGLPWIVLGLAIALFFGFGVASLGVFGGGPAAALKRVLGRVRIGFIERWLASNHRAFASTDDALRSLAHAGWKLAPTAASYLGAWLAESLETYLLLRFVGLDVTFVHALAFEPAIGLLRSLAFFAPAGLGVQDLGYVGLLTALGASDPASASLAFLALKRGRELAFALLGYGHLLGARVILHGACPTPIASPFPAKSSPASTASSAPSAKAAWAWSWARSTFIWKSASRSSS